MTALQLNADIYRSLGIISEDESVLRRVAKYLTRVAKQMTDDPTCMTKEEYFAMLDRSKEQAKRGEVYRFDNKEKMLNWLNTL
jgi:hypothetical protein